MKNEKKIENSAVVTEAAVPATTETKTKKTPTNERMYQLVAAPSIPPKGKQRQIVIAALQQDPNRGFSGKEVAEYATKAGLQATAGVLASCLWHLHHLELLGIAKVLNPSITVEVAKKEEVTA